MSEKIRNFSYKIKRTIFFVFAVLLAFVFSLLLLPLVLVFILAFFISTWFLIARHRHPRKGDIEILPAEKPPPVTSTSDTELEIKIETLQRKSGSKQIEPNDPSDDS